MELLNYQIPLWAVLAYFAFVAIVGGMPRPKSESGLAYQWAYTSLNLLAANLMRVASTTNLGHLFGVEEKPHRKDNK